MSRDLALLLLLAAITAIGPFALQALSPALPSVAASFEISAGGAQLLLSLSLIAIALATLVWGPLSDRYGRRPVIIAGLMLATAGSVIAALAPVLWVAIVGRLLQAAGAAAGMVLARAVAQDVYGADRAAGVIGKITAVMVAAPLVAPTLSGLVVEHTGWRGVFWMVGATGLVLIVWCRLALAETTTARVAGGIKDTLRGFGEISRSSIFWGNTAFASFSLTSFMFFVGTAPFVMENAFGRGPASYGFYFMLLAGAYMMTNFFCASVSDRLGARVTLVLGGTLAVLGPSLAALLLWAGSAHPIALFLPVSLHSVGAGLALPNAMAGAVAANPGRAGAASALLGFTQFLFAGIVTQMAALLPSDHAVPVPLVMAGLAALGLGSFLWLCRGSGARTT